MDLDESDLIAATSPDIIFYNDGLDETFACDETYYVKIQQSITSDSDVSAWNII